MKLYNLNGTEKADVMENKDVIVREIANAELQNGWHSNGSLSFLTKINNVVSLYLLVREGYTGIICNIPQQFRPKAIVVTFGGSNLKNALMTISANGNIEILEDIKQANVFLQTSWLTN